MKRSQMEYNLENAVNYHYGKFPPKTLDYEQFLEPLIKATDAVARYDQMLKNTHNSEIFLAPLRNQEAVISSRMEGAMSAMDEILKKILVMIPTGKYPDFIIKNLVDQTVFLVNTP